jgi:hypothetical protein
MEFTLSASKRGVVPKGILHTHYLSPPIGPVKNINNISNPGKEKKFRNDHYSQKISAVRK